MSALRNIRDDIERFYGSEDNRNKEYAEIFTDTVTLPANDDFLPIPDVKRYEPQVYAELTLVYVTVQEKHGRKWIRRSYWRIAGTQATGRYDAIRCDGPAYPARSTFVPANFRRAKGLDIGRKERRKDLVGQQKRYKIASVPMAIRFARAVELRKRLDTQAEKAFHAGNKARYDTLDARAAKLTDWLAHVATHFPDLAFKREAKAPTTDRQRFHSAIKAIPKPANGNGNRQERLAARKLREGRIARQAKWVSRVARSNGAHKTIKSR